MIPVLGMRSIALMSFLIAQFLIGDESIVELVISEVKGENKKSASSIDGLT